MNEEIEFILDATKEAMETAMVHLNSQLQKIRAGKASPMMLSKVQVEYYGALTPIGQVANISATDGRTLTVQPFEKSIIEAI